MQENFYGWIYITPNRFLNILKFELQYERTAPQISFCGYRVLQLLYRNIEGANDTKFSQK